MPGEIRTPTERSLKPPPLPLGYRHVCVSAPGRVAGLPAWRGARAETRTRTVEGLSLAPLPLGYTGGKEWCATGDSNSDWMRSKRIASAVGLVARALWWLRSTRLRATNAVLCRMS